MAEAAGLVLGALGIAGLFKSCVDNFDIVVRARDFSEEFDLLCTQVASPCILTTLQVLYLTRSSFHFNKSAWFSGESLWDSFLAKTQKDIRTARCLIDGPKFAALLPTVYSTYRIS